MLQVYPLQSWGALFGLLKGMRSYPSTLPASTRWKYVSNAVGAGYSPDELQFTGQRFESRYGTGSAVVDYGSLMTTQLQISWLLLRSSTPTSSTTLAHHQWS